jgi:hypothetical protein
MHPVGLRYDGDVEALRTLQILGERQALNRLKAANPEAFLYWHKVREVESG